MLLVAKKLRGAQREQGAKVDQEKGYQQPLTLTKGAIK